jgi:hypothetical protein
MEFGFKVSVFYTIWYFLTISILFYLEGKGYLNLPWTRYFLYTIWIIFLAASIKIFDIEASGLPKNVSTLFGVSTLLSGFSGIAITNLGHYLSMNRRNCDKKK